MDKNKKRMDKTDSFAKNIRVRRRENVSGICTIRIYLPNTQARASVQSRTVLRMVSTSSTP